MINTSKTTYRIALDAMGGDFAPKNEVLGAIEAFRYNKLNYNMEIVFVGNEQKIKKVLSDNDISGVNYSIVHTDEVVTMDDDPTAIIKTKKNSSLYKGAELHSQGYVDAFVSAGNTGAMLAISTVLLGRIKGVSRPTIGSFFPSLKDYPTLVLDVGANVDSKPRFLFEFAVMGSIYMNRTLGIENPKIGLLNIGEEKSKGGELALNTYALLQESSLNFIGNVEGRDLFSGIADIVVCDGFAGNVLLKFAESFPGFLKSKLKTFAESGILNKIIIALSKPGLKKVFSEFNYEEYGGVPLLGVNGVSIIGHGKSSPKAIRNMIFKAVEIIEKKVNQQIETALNPPEILKTKN
jgi:phosphate acyltransferase